MEQLGIEPLQLVTQIFNFAIMVALLTRFLYKPITKALKDRREKIEEGLKYAEKMRIEVEKTDKKRQSVLSSAREEAGVIIDEAKKSAKVVEAEIIVKAHEEARVIVEKGKADIEGERIDMAKKVKEQLIDVASAVASKALESSIPLSTHRAIIQKKIQMVAKQLS